MLRLAGFLLLVAACGPSSGAPADAGADVHYGKKSMDAGPAPEAGIDCDAGSTPSATYPAPHPALPQLVSQGGPVLAHPRFVPIVFAGDSQTATLGAFMSAVGSSTYWTSVAAEYGIGPASATAPIVVNETPAAQVDDADIRAWLADKLDGSHADFGTPDASAIYVVYYPAATTITNAGLGTSCSSFGGYHGDTKIGATQVVYAVIARCPNLVDTTVTSHELFEASTDPYFTAYANLDDPGSSGIGGEIGDLCESYPIVTPPDLGYAVVPVWSNAASAAGKKPCVPNDGAPNFGTMPAQRTVTIAPGDTATIQLVAFSDQPTAPWTVEVSQSAYDWSEKLDMTLCRATAQNGESIPLTLTRPMTATNWDDLTIVSKLGDVTTASRLSVGPPP